MRPLLRRSTVVVAVLMTAVAVVVSATPARAATDPTGSALDWLERELSTNGHQLGFKGFPDSTDWGLTTDFVLALAGGGRGAGAEAQATTSNIVANASTYITFDTPGELYAGPVAKLLHVLQVQGRATSGVAGLDLEATLRGLMQTSGDQVGRFSDQSEFGDNSNGFGQAYALLALRRTTAGVPAEALAFLLAQQCPAGGFRLYYDANPTCASDGEADTDVTGLVLQALADVPGASGAVGAATTWLIAQQAADGSFAGTGTTATPNANSTGIIAQGLRAVHQTAAADRAGAWLASLQLTDANAGAASGDIGAIAYDQGGFADAVANGLPAERDPFRRATSQGALALPTASQVPPTTTTAPSTVPSSADTLPRTGGTRDAVPVAVAFIALGIVLLLVASRRLAHDMQ